VLVSATFNRSGPVKKRQVTIQLQNQLPEDALGALCCKPSGFRKRVRKVINKTK
jgi:hypothetical protein